MMKRIAGTRNLPPHSPRFPDMPFSTVNIWLQEPNARIYKGGMKLDDYELRYTPKHPKTLKTASWVAGEEPCTLSVIK